MAALSSPLVQLPYRQAFLMRHLRQVLQPALARICRVDLRERPIERIFGKIETAEQLPQDRKTHLRKDKRLKLVEFFDRFFFCATDERHDARHNLYILETPSILFKPTLDVGVERLAILQ